MPSFALFPAALGGQHSIVALFLEAGPIAKLVFAVLLFFSLMSWGIMFNKGRLFRRVAAVIQRGIEQQAVPSPHLHYARLKSTTREKLGVGRHR